MSNNNVQSLIPTNETLRQEVMEEPIVSMSLVGSAWRITLSDLGERFANFIADVYKIDEIAGVMFIPDYDPNKRNLTERTQCFAIFDVRGVNPNTAGIYDNGSRDGSGSRMAVSVSNHSGQNGRFATSDKFRKTMVSIVAENAIEYGENNQVRLRILESPNNPNVPILELDINRLLEQALGIKSDSMNFAVTSADPCGGDNYAITILKYIENTGNKKGRKKGFNLQSIKQGITNQYGRKNRNGGNQGGGNHRRF